MDSVQISLSSLQKELLNNGTILKNGTSELYFLPYWFERVDDDVFYMHRLGNLPEHIVKQIRLHREITESIFEQKKESFIEPKTYHVQISHDNGIINLTTMATSYQNAIDIICKAEGCPERAIKKIWT
jgi:hypothetical protein